MKSLVGVLFCFLSSQPPGTCVGVQPLGVSAFPCTAWPFPQGCLPALLPSSPLYPCFMSYWFCHLSYKLLCVQPKSCSSFFIVVFHEVHQDVTRAPAVERESSHSPPWLPTSPSPVLPQLCGCLSHPSCEPA